MFGKKEIEQLKQENEQLKLAYEEVKKSYGLSKSKELKEENDKLLQDNRNYIDKLSTKQQEINNLNEQIKSANATLYRKQIDLDIAKVSIEKVETNNKKLEEELELSHKVNAQLRDEISKLEQDISIKDKEIQAYIQAIHNVSMTFESRNEIIKSNANEDIELDMLKALNTDLDDDVEMG